MARHADMRVHVPVPDFTRSTIREHIFGLICIDCSYEDIYVGAGEGLSMAQA